eukprot:TRINITY_DN11647_c0_g1_i1.p1 TRINITY_DN11647_c0_g1~~TRINITY_DN11647_c0_g1_i1.p1  ORF type:complete len:163 (+),score=33.37 TRINITY_DN11647_c0_g1_i1:44-532(+)
MCKTDIALIPNTLQYVSFDFRHQESLSSSQIKAIHEIMIENYVHYRLAAKFLAAFKSNLAVLIRTGNMRFEEYPFVHEEETAVSLLPPDERKFQVQAVPPREGIEHDIMMICDVLHRYCENFTWKAIYKFDSFKEFRRNLNHWKSNPNFQKNEEKFTSHLSR